MGEFKSHYFAPAAYSPPPDQRAVEGETTSFDLGSFDSGIECSFWCGISGKSFFLVDWGDGTDDQFAIVDSSYPELHPVGARGHQYPNGVESFEVTVTVTNSRGFSDRGTFQVNIDAMPSISVTKTAAPTSVPEPSGLVTFTVRVDNLSTETVSLPSLVDDIHGDLNGQGTCTVPQTLSGDGFYECSFSATVSGNPGDSETSTVTVTAEDDEANSVQAQGSATVTITDVLPSISVTKTADLTSVPEPGGLVTFTVRVDNLVSIEAASLTSLVDDIHGNLNGQGACAVPQTIPADGFYQCSFPALVLGYAGDSETGTVTATAEDDEANSTQGQGSATVTVTHSLVRPVPTLGGSGLLLMAGLLGVCGVFLRMRYRRGL